LRVVTGDLATAAAVHRIGLAPLSPTAVAPLAATGGLDPVALHRRTDGNPFFVTEVLAAGGHGISATVHDASWPARPACHPAARSILEAAAVIGARVDPPRCSTPSAARTPMRSTSVWPGGCCGPSKTC
jgi:hypothetical protein